jgi:LuxR family maltose regulon positive regulatory protein
MDITGLAATKIQPPRTRSVRIARPALDAALREAMRSKRLVLLVAPAGFGKTSALAAQLAALDAGTALAWVTLEEDDDPVRLFAALAAALEPFDLPWRSAPAALAGQLGEEEGVATRAAVAELVNALAASEAPHGVIVFDDLHRVQSPEVHALLDALIERLPLRWTVVVSTRIAPRLALARWRAADELAEFGQEALRFSLDEARALAAAEQLPGLEERLPELMERTHGWPAGLRLCFAALRGRSGGAPLGASSRHSAVDRSLFDYLASEIIDEMPIALHDFMVRSSVLPVLTAGAAAAVTGDARAAQRLDEIERRGLFVTALDADEHTLVLHDLFRDALEDRLRRRFPDELPLLLRRAAAIERDPLRRVALQLRAGDWAAAEAALAQEGDELLLQGLATEMSRAIAQFPSAWREHSPRLLRLDAIAECMRWHWNPMAALLEASVAAAKLRGEEDELRLSQSMLLAAWNAIDQPERSEALLAELDGCTLPPRAALLALDARCSLHFQRGEFGALRERFEEVIQWLEANGSLFDWWMVSPPTAWAAIPGVGTLVERFCAEALGRCGERELPMRATLQALQAATLLWAGRVDAALARAAEAESDARWLARAPEIEVALHSVRVFVEALRGDAKAVRSRLDKLFRHADGVASPGRLNFWRGHVARIAVRALDLLGADAAALRHWQAWHARPGEAGAADPLVARLLAAEGRWPEAAEAFMALLPQVPALDLMGQGIELHLRAAHTLLRAGRAARAAAPLAAALQRVAEWSSHGHALMAGPQVLGALAAHPWGSALTAAHGQMLQALATQSAVLRGGARAPAVAAPRSPAEPGATAAADPSAGLLSGREREVLERIAAGDSNKLIARALDISPHTVKRHVANILDKLGLQSRGQAAAWLRAHP